MPCFLILCHVSRRLMLSRINLNISTSVCLSYYSVDMKYPSAVNLPINYLHICLLFVDERCRNVGFHNITLDFAMRKIMFGTQIIKQGCHRNIRLIHLFMDESQFCVIMTASGRLMQLSLTMARNEKSANVVCIKNRNR